MSVYNKYLNLKDKHKDSIVMIKVGNFYYVYDEDSIIMYYLFKYKINDNRIGFLVKVLDKVIKVFNKNKISYYVENKNQEFDDNCYHQILEKAKSYYELSLDIEDIYDYLINNIERKYIKRIINKIKEVIDEG